MNQINNALDEMGNEITPEQMAEVQAKAMQSFYQVLSFAASICALSFSCSLLVSTIELWIYGIYTRTDAMMTLGGILLLVSFCTVAGTIFGSLGYTMPPEAPARRRRLMFYLLTAMLMAPCTGMCSLLCFALSDGEFLQLPWVQEFTGINVEAYVADLIASRGVATSSEQLGEDGASWSMGDAAAADVLRVNVMDSASVGVCTIIYYGLACGVRVLSDRLHYESEV